MTMQMCSRKSKPVLKKLGSMKEWSRGHTKGSGISTRLPMRQWSMMVQKRSRLHQIGGRMSVRCVALKSRGVGE